MDVLPRFKLEIGKTTEPNGTELLRANAYVLCQSQGIGEPHETFVVVDRLAFSSPAFDNSDDLRHMFDRLRDSVLSLKDPMALKSLTDAHAAELCQRYMPENERNNLIGAVRIPYAVNCTRD